MRARSTEATGNFQPKSSAANETKFPDPIQEAGSKTKGRSAHASRRRRHVALGALGARSDVRPPVRNEKLILVSAELTGHETVRGRLGESSGLSMKGNSEGGRIGHLLGEVVPCVRAAEVVRRKEPALQEIFAQPRGSSALKYSDSACQSITKPHRNSATSGGGRSEDEVAAWVFADGGFGELGQARAEVIVGVRVVGSTPPALIGQSARIARSRRSRRRSQAWARLLAPELPERRQCEERAEQRQCKPPLVTECNGSRQREHEDRIRRLRNARLGNRVGDDAAATTTRRRCRRAPRRTVCRSRRT